jgi:ketosteroid isomerase-like protein
MATTDHPNVELVRRGFAALAVGDVEAAMNQYAPDLRYVGSDQFGQMHECGSRDEFFEMVVEAMALHDEFTNDVVDAFAVGDELVMVHVLGHRRSRASGESLDTDLVMALRVQDGVVTRGVDLIDSRAESYFERLAGS